MTARAAGKNPYQFIDRLEQQATDYAVKTLRLPALNNGNFAGLLLFTGDVDTAELGRLTTRALTQQVGDKTPASRQNNDSAVAGLLPEDHFRRLLQIEIDRVERTRLPCALVCLEIDGFPVRKASREDLENCTRCIANQLHSLDILGYCQFSRKATNVMFGIIMPATNVGKGLQRVTRIFQALQKNLRTFSGIKASSEVFIGISICHAGASLNVDAFTSQAMAEMTRARKEKRTNICHSSGVNPEDGCQVSAEEKAHLFSFLTKG